MGVRFELLLPAVPHLLGVPQLPNIVLPAREQILHYVRCFRVKAYNLNL